MSPCVAAARNASFALAMGATANNASAPDQAKTRDPVRRCADKRRTLLGRCAARRCATGGPSGAPTATAEVHHLAAVGQRRALQRAAGLTALQRPNDDLDL